MAAYMGNTGCTACLSTPNNSPQALTRIAPDDPRIGPYLNPGRQTFLQTYASGAAGTPDATVGQVPNASALVTTAAAPAPAPVICGGACARRQALTIALLLFVVYSLARR